MEERPGEETRMVAATHDSQYRRLAVNVDWRGRLKWRLSPLFFLLSPFFLPASFFPFFWPPAFFFLAFLLLPPPCVCCHLPAPSFLLSVFLDRISSSFVRLLSFFSPLWFFFVFLLFSFSVRLSFLFFRPSAFCLFLSSVFLRLQSFCFLLACFVSSADRISRSFSRA